jgi:replicative DNA helicase
VFELTAGSHRTAVEPAGPVLYRVFKSLEQRYTAKEAITGIPTGIGKLDEMTAGLQPGHLVIVAGASSMGKTSFVMNLIDYAAVYQGFPALILSCEQGREEMLEKLLCIDARVDTEKMRVGALATADWTRLTAAGSRVAEAPIHIDDAGSPTLAEIRSKARRWRNDAKAWKPRKKKMRDGTEAMWTPPTGIIALDYIQMANDEIKKGETRATSLGRMSRGMKLIAKELGCAFIALSQLTREVAKRGDHRPTKSDLRESGNLEQDADEIVFLHRPEYYDRDETKDEDRGIAEIIVDKQRNGRTGTVRSKWVPESTRFENL